MVGGKWAPTFSSLNAHHKPKLIMNQGEKTSCRRVMIFALWIPAFFSENSWYTSKSERWAEFEHLISIIEALWLAVTTLNSIMLVGQGAEAVCLRPRDLMIPENIRCRFFWTPSDYQREVWEGVPASCARSTVDCETNQECCWRWF